MKDIPQTQWRHTCKTLIYVYWPVCLTGLILATLLFISGCAPKAQSPQSQKEVASVGLNSGALSPSGKMAIVGSIHHGISLWRTTDEERLFDWSHKKKESTVLIDGGFSSDERWALTADVNSLVLWDTQTGEAARFWQAPSEIHSVALGPNANFALLGLDDHTSVLFNIRQGGVVRTLHHNNRVRSVALSKDGKKALTGSEDYQAIFWDLEKEEAVSRVQHNDEVQLVQLSNDGTLALSASKYDRALIWKTETGETLGELPLHAEAIKRGLRFTSARFSEDNQLLVTGRPDQLVMLWDVKTLKEVARWRIPKRKAWKPQGAAIIDLAFEQDNKHIIVLSSNGFLSKLSY